MKTSFRNHRESWQWRGACLLPSCSITQESPRPYWVFCRINPAHLKYLLQATSTENWSSLNKCHLTADPLGMFLLILLPLAPPHATNPTAQSNNLKESCTLAEDAMDFFLDLAMKWVLTYCFPKCCALLSRDSGLVAHIPLLWTRSYLTSLCTCALDFLLSSPEVQSTS